MRRGKTSEQRNKDEKRAARLAPKTGVELIAAERQRQVDVEGFTAEHDDEHISGELAAAAVCYAAPRLVLQMNQLPDGMEFVDPWPAGWGQWDGRVRQSSDGALLWNVSLPHKDRIRNLVKAGALIAAEIDRLQRA